MSYQIRRRVFRLAQRRNKRFVEVALSAETVKELTEQYGISVRKEVPAIVHEGTIVEQKNGKAITYLYVGCVDKTELKRDPEAAVKKELAIVFGGAADDTK